MKIECTPTGMIELRLLEDADHFRHFAELVRKKLGGRWTEQLDHLDQSYWDLDVEGKKITVHREHYLGVSVLCENNAVLRALLERLQRDLDPTA